MENRDFILKHNKLARYERKGWRVTDIGEAIRVTPREDVRILLGLTNTAHEIHHTIDAALGYIEGVEWVVWVLNAQGKLSMTNNMKLAKLHAHIEETVRLYGAADGWKSTVAGWCPRIPCITSSEGYEYPEFDPVAWESPDGSCQWPVDKAWDEYIANVRDLLPERLGSALALREIAEELSVPTDEHGSKVWPEKTA